MIAFAKARLDEDEAAAREAAGLTENWIAEDPAIGVVLVDGEPLIEGHIAGLTAHIARHDPARVLREVAAGRRILGRHKPVDYHGISVCQWDTCSEGEQPWPCPDILDSIAVWSDHPDYQEAWKP
jgi:hypothetical protein